MNHPFTDGAIALEEHYLDAELAEHFRMPEFLKRRLLDQDARLSEMDSAGIALQVLSLVPDGAQGFPASSAVAAAEGLNNRLAATVATRPDRFRAFATLPTPDPDAAARELERCVKELGFCGAMVHGLTEGKFHDDRRFWPIFAAAEELDVPIYLHPHDPHRAVWELYFKDYADNMMFDRAALGYTVEMLTAAVRMVQSGVFESHPRLRFILGHMGEAVPFLLERIDESLSRGVGGRRYFRSLFLKHFTVTTSGNFSDTALRCTIDELGVERIMFSVDWPFCENSPAMNWIENAPIPDGDRAAIMRDNAHRILRL